MPEKTTKQWLNNSLEEIYYHSLPKYLQFLVFLHRGIFSGMTNFNLSRTLCWFNIHKMKYYEGVYFDKIKNEDYKKMWGKCERCGCQ